jgi:DNA-binding MarR family transcriptional regulator
VNDIVGAGKRRADPRPAAESAASHRSAAEGDWQQPTSDVLAAGDSQRLAADVLAAGDSQRLAADVLAAGDSQRLAADVLAAVSAIRRVARRAARAAWRAEPLPPAQSELLRLAAGRPGISVAEAAHELRLAPNTVSTLVGRLSAAGLLERTRAEFDGRSVRLAVTDKAARRIAEWRDLRAELATHALDRLTVRDREALADAVPALLRFAAQLEEEQ